MSSNCVGGDGVALEVAVRVTSYQLVKTVSKAPPPPPPPPPEKKLDDVSYV